MKASKTNKKVSNHNLDNIDNSDNNHNHCNQNNENNTHNQPNKRGEFTCNMQQVCNDNINYIQHQNHQHLYYNKYNDRLNLKDIILNLSKNNMESICTHILLPNHENVTVNQSGVFFDLMTLSDTSIQQIKKHIDHIKQIKL